MVEALFERVVPKDKESPVPREKIEGESKETVTKPETGKTEGESKETASKPETGKTEKEFNKTNELLGKLSEEIEELRNKVSKFERKIRNLEDLSSTEDNSLEDRYILLKKVNEVENFIRLFNEKLIYIEETKKKILQQISKISDMYYDMQDKLEGLDSLLNKMHRFDSIFDLADRLENFETKMKNKIEVNLSTWNFPLETVEHLKSSLLEQNFYSLVSLLPLVKKPTLQVSILEQIKKLIDEMKKKNLWNLDKKYLLEELLNIQNIREASLV